MSVPVVPIGVVSRVVDLPSVLVVAGSRRGMVVVASSVFGWWVEISVVRVGGRASGASRAFVLGMVSFSSSSVGSGPVVFVPPLKYRSILALEVFVLFEELFWSLVVVIWSEVAVESSLLSVEMANVAHDVPFCWRDIPCRATDNIYDSSRPNRGWWEIRRK